jgi:hypothetical protein
LAVLLAALGGLIAFTWEARDLPPSVPCGGYAEGSSQPNWPHNIAWVLVALPVVVTTLRALTERRHWLVVVVLFLAAGALGAFAVEFARIWLAATRHCFE